MKELCELRIFQRPTCDGSKRFGPPSSISSRLWKGMANLSYPPMPPIYWLVISYIITMSIQTAFSCDMQICWDRFREAEAAAKSGLIKTSNNEDVNCVAFRTQLECIISLYMKCKRNLQYEGLKQSIIINMNKIGCPSNGSTYVYDPAKPRTNWNMNNELMCSFQGVRPERKYGHCSLFGDPHLRTFGNEFQTCKVEGTWTLLYSKNLSVQVTNDPVVMDGSATATSKLTVMIKKNEDCVADKFKTYMAQTDNLPGTFSDGQTHYGPERSVHIRELEPGKNIEIYLRYIDTTIRVRQIGRYFTFAIKMPEELIDETKKLGNVQLCIQGCPKREQINYQKYLADKRKAVAQQQGNIKMTRDEASDLCRQEKVVDFYFDSCVFDLMTTGDTNFTMAAYQAWQDLVVMSPEFVQGHQNRTDFTRYDEIHSSSSRTTCFESVWILVLSVLICVYFHHKES